MANPDPFALLKEDHRAVEKLFAELEDTTERAEKTRKEVFAKLKAALETHSTIEEAILYPAMEAADLTHALALEAEAEHEQVKTLLAELDSMPETSEEWTAKLTVLKENVSHHVEEEENTMFPKTEQALSEEELSSLGESIAAAKEEVE